MTIGRTGQVIAAASLGVVAVIAAVYWQRNINGCGTVFGLVTALYSHGIVYRLFPAGSFEQNLSRIWVVDGALNVGLFIFVVGIVTWLFRGRPVRFLLFTVLGLALLQVLLLVVLIPASDCP